MTDHQGEPSGENSALGSTSEPVASIEDQAWISGLLGRLAATDQQIPATIAASIDQALADEQRHRSTGLEGSATESASTSDTRWNPRWLAIAAAAVVLIGGAWLYQQPTTSNGPSTGTADSSYVAASAPENATSAQLASETRVVNAPNAMVRQATVAAQVTTILASAQPMDTSMSAADPSMTHDVTTKANSWAECLATITGTAGNPPTAVITGVSYSVQTDDLLVARAADLVIRPVAGDITHLDVWIVEPGCSANQTKLLDHRVISATS